VGATRCRQIVNTSEARPKPEGKVHESSRTEGNNQPKDKGSKRGRVLSQPSIRPQKTSRIKPEEENPENVIPPGPSTKSHRNGKKRKKVRRGVATGEGGCNLRLAPCSVK